LVSPELQDWKILHIQRSTFYSDVTPVDVIDLTCRRSQDSGGGEQECKPRGTESIGEQCIQIIMRGDSISQVQQRHDE
jgi:hypothetical protein